MTEEIKKTKKNFIFKFGILLFIGVLIIGIYFIKNSRIEESENIVLANETVDEIIPLEIETIDLEQLKQNNLPFVIDFGSDACIPCKQMAPVLETLHREFQGKAIIHFVDVWKNQEAALEFPVSVIPTQFFYTAEGVPFLPSEDLAEELEFIYYSSSDTNEHLFTVHQGGITEAQMRKIFAEMGVQ